MTVTMTDAELQLASLGYAQSFEKNLRASIRKCVMVYGAGLDHIPADLDAFDRKWGRGRVRVPPVQFKTAQAFKTWRKNVRMVLTRLSGFPQQTSLIASCAKVLAVVRDNQGSGQVLGANSDLTIGVVIRAASRANLNLADITPKWINLTALHLSNGQRKSFRRGLLGINRLIARQSELPELAGMLPENSLPLPVDLRPIKSSWHRSADNSASDAIWSDFDRIIRLKQFGEDGPQIAGSPSAFKQTSVDSYENSMNWLLSQLTAQDRLDEGADLTEAITHSNLVVAVNYWIGARKARGLNTESSSLYSHISRLVHLAVNYLEIAPKEVKRLVELRRKPVIRTSSVGKMSAKRERWIRNFDRDLAKQEKAHFLPELLMKRSKVILARADGNLKVRPSDLMMALRVGVAALQVAILFRASPVRSSNLRTLRMRGAGAELATEKFMQEPRLRSLRLWIPGSQVKNLTEIDEIADDDLAPLLHWYLAEIRPRLIASHPFGKNYRDSDYLFPSTTEGPMERSNFSSMFRDACREVGFDMEMHQARHVCAYWILSIDPNAWGEAAALLGDDEMTVRRYYGWLNERQASQAARDKLRSKRAFSGQHRQGDYTDVI